MESSSDRLRRSVVGREAELAAVAAFLEADTLGPSALVMAGEAGIGKTTIMRVAVERASSGGLRVLLACPSAGERRLPYAALADLIGGLPISAVVGLAPPQRSAVGVALGREDGAVDEHALARGVLELLRLWGAAVVGPRHVATTWWSTTCSGWMRRPRQRWRSHSAGWTARPCVCSPPSEAGVRCRSRPPLDWRISRIRGG